MHETQIAVLTQDGHTFVVRSEAATQVKPEQSLLGGHEGDGAQRREHPEHGGQVQSGVYAE